MGTAGRSPGDSPSAPDRDRAFHFWGCSEIRESLGLRAHGERQLLERLEVLPAESIYYHSVRCLLRRQILPSPFPDDFARWVALEVRDLELAEQLALSSPFDFPEIEAFRAHLLEILDDHLAHMPFSPRALGGRPFYFLRGHLAAVPLELGAADLAALRRGMAEVDESSIYFHTVEAIGLGNPRGDFAAWIEDVLARPDLARRVRELDPFVVSLGQIRQQLLTLLDEELGRAA
jgi:Family of unknown function (DUF5752)